MTADHDRWADSYEKELDRAVGFVGLRHEFFSRAKAEELLGLARRHLGSAREIDALDVGCGVGLADSHLQGCFASLTGTDLSRTALDRAARRNPWARYEPAAGGRLPFSEESFDLVFAMCVLQELEPDERAEFASELARVTRAGGLVVFFEHNPRNPLTRLAVRRTEVAAGIRFLGPGDLAELLAAQRLVVVEQAHILLFPARVRPLLAVERLLRHLPLGAQHYTAARRV
ncbi:MAG: class I SAM-dependent methyltransferase [Actinobacteria bacterium]|nr:class I SAM-dependent methyltransferase [Actinomycetota bacterium]